jgi:hypothetical protein
MSENGRNNQAPLKIPAAKAVSQLQNCEEKGEKLYHLLNDLYNSRRERPIRKNTIDSFKAKLNLWIEQTARIIKDIYADETYIRNFGTNLIDDEWFNLTSTKLRENMFNSRKELTQLQYEWDSADTKQKKHLKMKILKGQDDKPLRRICQIKVRISNFKDYLSNSIRITPKACGIRISNA